MDQLVTGDLLLFSGNSNDRSFFGLFDSLIKWGTHSNYTHTAVVLKNPTFINPVLKGTYVWESGWEKNPDPQDGIHKYGVRITPLAEILESYRNTGGTCFYRKMECDSSHFTSENLSNIHNIVYKKPYDICPLDWIEAYLKRDLNPQKTSRFWCSALVGFIYTKCGILDPNTDWSILSPNDLSLSGQQLNFTPGNKLSNSEIKLI